MCDVGHGPSRRLCHRSQCPLPVKADIFSRTTLNASWADDHSRQKSLRVRRSLAAPLCRAPCRPVHNRKRAGVYADAASTQVGPSTAGYLLISAALATLLAPWFCCWFIECFLGCFAALINTRALTRLFVCPITFPCGLIHSNSPLHVTALMLCCSPGGLGARAWTSEAGCGASVSKDTRRPSAKTRLTSGSSRTSHRRT